MLPRFWAASTKGEAALVHSQGWTSLGKGEGGLWRRAIAGQKPGVYCLERHEVGGTSRGREGTPGSHSPATERAS
jgi:hypothetical protein